MMQPQNGMTPEKYKMRKSIRFTGNVIGLGEVLGIAMAYLFVFAVQIIALVFGAGEDFFTSVPYEMLTQIFYTLLTCVVPFILCAKLLQFKVADLVPLGPTRPGITALLVLIALSASIVGSYATSILDSVLSVFGASAKMPEFPQPSDPIGFVLSLLVIAVAPALMEEFAFRGIILGSLRRFGDGVAIFVSALLFGLFHGNLVQIPSAFVMGLALGYITVLSGSMWPAVIAHFVNNLLATVLPYLYAYLPQELVTPVDGLVTILMLSGGLLAGVCLILRNPGALRLPKPKTAVPVESRIGWLLSTPMILVTFGINILFIVMVQTMY